MDKQKEDFQKRLNDAFVRVMSERSVKDVARAMGVSVWTLYKYLEGVDFPVHRAELLYRATGDIRILQAMMPKGVLVVAPKIGDVGEVFSAAAKNAREAGEARAVLMEALKNGRIDPWEIEPIRKEFEEEAASCHEVVYACEIAAGICGNKEVQLCFA